MCVSIEYSGRIRDRHKLSQLIEDISNIVALYGWKTKVYGKEFPLLYDAELYFHSLLGRELDGKLYGIEFTPIGCEAVSVCFLNNGRISSEKLLERWKDAEAKTETEVKGELDYLYRCRVVTQGGGPKVHEQLVGVMRFLLYQYIDDLQVWDKTQFWDTDNREQLQMCFKKHDELLQAAKDEL